MRRPPALPLLALALAGCNVGPRSPDARIVLPPARPSEVFAADSGPAQYVRVGAVPLAHWWTAFGSGKLDALVADAFARNNDLATADAAWRQAAELAGVAAGGQGPQVDLNLQEQRARIAADLATPLANPNAYDYTLHTGQVTVAYPLDLFGGGRSKVRSARAAAEVARQKLRAARTTVIANLVQAVIQHAALEAEVAAQREAIASNRALLTMIQRRNALGDVGLIDVAAQETALASAEAALPPLERQLAHQRGLIASLTGRAAGGTLPPLPRFDELHLPTDLPVALPGQIVANRPDVAAAAAQMQGAAADLGTAIAARLPAIQLTGNAGGAATALTRIFATPSLFYTLIGAVTQPLFHSGALLHQQRASAAALQGAKAQYRAAALQAFLDVDDALNGLRTDAAALDAATRTDRAARQTLTFARRQVALGAQGTFGLLGTQSTAALAAVQRVQAFAARLSDTVALFQAVGTPTDAAAVQGTTR